MTSALPCSVVRELDRVAIEECGIPSLLLMENAGRACADACLALMQEAEIPGPVLVLAGPGNNGGDGFVIARTLFNRGVLVRLFFIGPANKLDALSGDTQTNARLWRELEPEQTVIEGAEDLAAALARGAAFIVDAMFGTGLSRELSQPWLEAVRAVNESQVRVLAVDIPSGLHGDTGQVLGAAVRASQTVTFVAPKPGLLCGEGPEHTGELFVAEIGIPRRLIDGAYADQEVRHG